MRVNAKSVVQPLLIVLVASHLVFGALFLLQRNGGFQQVELLARDKFIGLGSVPAAPSRPITLIGITEEDIRSYGWPLSDRLLAELLDRLVQMKPRVVGVDVYRDVPVGEGADTLNKVLSGNPNIIFAEKFPDGSGPGVAPPPVLKDTAQVGFTDVAPDPEGIVRRGLLYLNAEDRYGTSLALQMALIPLAAEGIQPEPDPANPDLVRLGRSTIVPFENTDGGYVDADAQGYQFLLDFGGIGDAFPTFSMGDVLGGRVSRDDVTGRILVLGVVAQSVNDFFFAPVAVSADGSNRIPGIVLHALIVDQILRMANGDSKPVTSFTDRQELTWLWFWCLVGAGVALRTRSLPTLALRSLAGAGLIGTAGFLAFRDAVWIPVVSPAAGWIASMALVTAHLSVQEHRARVVLMSLFSRHVSADVAKLIWEKRDEIVKDGSLQPQRQVATVLFTDLVGFTAVSEKLEPETLMKWLNGYMDAVSQLVIAHGGVIDKYIGDAVMAVWGVPFVRTTETEFAEDATRAVKSALAMREQLKVLNDGWREQGLSAVSMRVGIHTGPLVAGSLGGRERADYTVIGDTVNIASRLESYDKTFNPDGDICRILIGDTTERLVRGKFRTSPVGSVDLKGREQAMQVFRVTSIASAGS